MQRDFEELAPSGDILRYGASMVLHSGPHDMHGWAPMFSWVDFQLAQVQQYMKEADQVLVVGKLTGSYLEPLLRRFRRKVRIVELP